MPWQISVHVKFRTTTCKVCFVSRDAYRKNAAHPGPHKKRHGNAPGSVLVRPRPWMSRSDRRQARRSCDQQHHMYYCGLYFYAFLIGPLERFSLDKTRER